MAEKVDDNGTIPAGSPPLQEEPEKEPVKEETKAELDRVEALSSELENLQQVFGRHTNEIGELRQANEMLVSQNQELEQVLAEINAKANTGDDAVADIYQRIENGDVGLAEGLKLLNESTRESTVKETLVQASRSFQEELAMRDQAEVERRFVDSNPDYMEYLLSGAIDETKKKNPLHSNLSAYYELKAIQAYEKGKEDLANEEKGALGAGKVLTKPGATIRQVNKPKTPLTELEMKQSGAAALERLREAERAP